MTFLPKAQQLIGMNSLISSLRNPNIRRTQKYKAGIPQAKERRWFDRLAKGIKTKKAPFRSLFAFGKLRMFLGTARLRPISEEVVQQVNHIAGTDDLIAIGIPGFHGIRCRAISEQIVQ
jgi:hypothetical protein